MFVWNKRAEKVLIDNKNKTQLPLALWEDVDVNHVSVAIAFAIVIVIVIVIVIPRLRNACKLQFPPPGTSSPRCRPNSSEKHIFDK